MNKVLIIDPVSSGSVYPSLLEGLGISVVSIDTERSLTGGLRKEATAGSLSFQNDFDSDATRLAAYCADNQIRWIIIGAESGVPLAEELRELVPAFGKNAPGNRRRRWDKAAMAEALNDAGVPAPKTLVVESLEDLKEISNKQSLFEGGPLVVKPSISAGSVDVSQVGTSAELIRAVTKILANPGLFGDQASALVQEAITGQEYIVDTVSHGGLHAVVAVCVYEKHLSEQGSFVYDRLRWISPDDELYEELIGYAAAVLDALGLRYGAGHMEMIMSPTGPRFIDFGARPHGAGHPMRTYHLTGNSQIHAESQNAVAALRSEPPQVIPYQLTLNGAIEFLSVDRPRQAISNPDPTPILDQIEVVECLFNIRPNETYPTTENLLDGLNLGLVFVAASTEDGLSVAGRKIRRAFLSNFTDS